MSATLTQPRAAMGTGTDASGGFITPADLDPIVVQQLERTAVARRFSHRVEMSSSPYKVSAIETRPVAEVLAEGASETASDPTFAGVEISALKHRASTIVSNEWLEDTIDATSLAVSQANAIGALEDSTFFTAVTSGLTSKVTGAATLGALTLADFLGLIALVDVQDIEPPRFYCSRAAYALAALNVQGSVGVLSEPAILGHEVVLTNGLPGATATTGDMPFIFGYLDRASVFGIRTEAATRFDTQSLALNDQTRVITSSRVGVSLWDADGPCLAGLELGT